MSAAVAGQERRHLRRHDPHRRLAASTAARAYQAAGAGKLSAIATHGLFPGDALERLQRHGSVQRHRLHRQPPARPGARRTVPARRVHRRRPGAARWRSGYLKQHHGRRRASSTRRRSTGTATRRDIVAAHRAARARRRQRALPARSCASPGYGCEDAFLAPACRRRAQRVLHELAARDARAWSCPFGLPLLYHNALFNAACLVVDGADRRLRRQALPGRRRHPLRAALVQALAGRATVATSQLDGAALPARRSALRRGRRAASASRSARTPGWRTRPGARAGARGRRHHPQPSAPATSPSASTRSASASCSRARAPSASATSTPTCSATRRAARSTTAAR